MTNPINETTSQPIPASTQSPKTIKGELDSTKATCNDCKTTLSQGFLTLPISYFSMVLGLLAFGLALRYAEHAQIIPAYHHISEGVLTLGMLLWLCLLLAYVGKWLFYITNAKAEIQNIVLCCFVSLIPITTMLVGMTLLPHTPVLAESLIWLGTVGQLLFSAYRGGGLWQGKHNFLATTPILYLPTVASNFVSSAGLALAGHQDIAWLFFGAGVLSWLSLEPAIVQRLRHGDPVAPAMRGVLGIQLAPAFVAGNTYLILQQGNIDNILYMLVGYGLLQGMFLLRLLPWIFADGIKINVWGFSFGLASMVSIGAHFIVASGHDALVGLGWVMFMFASVIISAMLLLTFFWFGRWLFNRGL